MKEISLPDGIDRNLFISSNISQDSCLQLTKTIIAINELDDTLETLYKINGQTYNRTPMKLYIDSYGGDVYTALGLISLIENSKTEIHSISSGCAMSCGFMIAIACHKRYSYKYTTFMIHDISNGAFGQSEVIRDELAEMDRLKYIIDDIINNHTKIRYDKLKDVYSKKKDWFISADLALKMKVIDEII